jgi:hypothetical protein
LTVAEITMMQLMRDNKYALVLALLCAAASFILLFR